MNVNEDVHIFQVFVVERRRQYCFVNKPHKIACYEGKPAERANGLSPCRRLLRPRSQTYLNLGYGFARLRNIWASLPPGYHVGVRGLMGLADDAFVPVRKPTDFAAELQTNGNATNSMYQEINTDSCHLRRTAHINDLTSNARTAVSEANPDDFRCTTCGYQFRSPMDKRLHASWHSVSKARSSRLYKCMVCGKQYGFPSELKAHMFRHSEFPAFPCEHCGKRFKHSRNLKEHKLKIHLFNSSFSNMPPNKEAFSILSRLRSRRHSGSTRQEGYQCTYCGQRFKIRRALHKHKSTVHHGITAEKVVKHECTVCKQWFMCNRDLRRHSVSHTRQRLFSCALCGNSYLYATNLQRHRLTVHRDEQVAISSTDEVLTGNGATGN
ncbi:zinc finger and BTB domain-containing protein 49 [Clonorchis sinensis]|uniref:Zinc finger and BTB domain-containing protein 49 n=1 Tax=Clonorchis sinensis TaxID=79923 RepID=H2KV13_CLOSI|nr:zinc finger and BTB domain-containing protein 49 [Clonorchis sinensis]